MSLLFIHSKICSLANRETSMDLLCLEFQKIFTMIPGSDIFQYHADLMQQIKLVAAQGESLGLKYGDPGYGAVPPVGLLHGRCLSIKRLP